MHRKIGIFLLKTLNILVPVSASLLLGAIAIRLVGASPARVYTSIVRSAFFSLDGFMSSLVYATPLIIIGVSLVVAFRGGIWNMGSEGQLYMGAFFGTYLGFTLTGLPAWLHVTICLLGGFLMGGLWALIPAVLKSYFRISDTVTSLMLNYVAIMFCNYLATGPFSYSYQYTATKPIYSSAEIPPIFSNYTVSWMFVLALVVAAVIAFMTYKTTFGYEVDVIGHQPEFAESVGMNLRKRYMQIFLISGALAGLAGAGVCLSVYKRFTPTFSANPGLGWDGMMATMLGNNSPIGTIIAAIIFGGFKFGSVSLQVKLGVPTEVIEIVQSSLMLFLSVRLIKTNSKIYKRLIENSPVRLRAFRKKR